MPRNRSLPPHLEIRQTGYYWRRRLPRSLRDRGAPDPSASDKTSRTPSTKLFLCFSLRTHVRSDAKILARRLTEMSDLVFAADAEMMMAIATEIQVQLLESLARFEIEAFERARAVAAQLGIEVDNADGDWNSLAYEATKVLLDLSQERARRQQGIYDQPTVFFRRAVSTAAAAAPANGAMASFLTVAPAAFASDAPIPAQAPPASAPFASEMTAAPQKAALAHVPTMAHAQRECATSPDQARSDAHSPHNMTCPVRVVVPVGLDCPAGYDDARWQEARIAARQPRILIDRKLLSEASRAALDKPRGISTPEAIELYFELLSWGYRPPFDKHQKRKKVPAELKEATLEERLGVNYLGKYRLAKAYWPAAFGDDPVDEISVDDVNDALEHFWGVPAHHGRSEKDRNQFSVMELIEKADAKDAQLARKIKDAIAEGASSEQIDKMRLENHKPRISVTTYINHGRVLANVGRMLMDMQLIDQNPFSVCSWSNEEVNQTGFTGDVGVRHSAAILAVSSAL